MKTLYNSFKVFILSNCKVFFFKTPNKTKLMDFFKYKILLNLLCKLYYNKNLYN